MAANMKKGAASKRTNLSSLIELLDLDTSSSLASLSSTPTGKPHSANLGNLQKRMAALPVQSSEGVISTDTQNNLPTFSKSGVHANHRESTALSNSMLLSSPTLKPSSVPASASSSYPSFKTDVRSTDAVNGSISAMFDPKFSDSTIGRSIVNPEMESVAKYLRQEVTKLRDMLNFEQRKSRDFEREYRRLQSKEIEYEDMFFKIKTLVWKNNRDDDMQMRSSAEDGLSTSELVDYLEHSLETSGMLQRSFRELAIVLENDHESFSTAALPTLCSRIPEVVHSLKSMLQKTLEDCQRTAYQNEINRSELEEKIIHLESMTSVEIAQWRTRCLDLEGQASMCDLLRQELLDLKGRMDAVSGDKASLEEDVGSLRAENGRLKKDLENSLKKNDEYERMSASHSSKIRMLEEHLKSYQIVHEEWKTSTQSAIDGRRSSGPPSGSRSLSKGLSNQLPLVSDTAAETASATAWRERYEDIQRELDSLRSSATLLQHENMTLKREKDAAAMDTRSISQECSRLRKEYEEAKQWIDDLCLKLQRKEDDVTSVREELRLLKEDFVVEEDRKKSALSELRDWKAKAILLESSLSSAASELQELQDVHQHLEKDHMDLAASIAKLEARNASLEERDAEFQAIRSESAVWREKESELRKRIHSLEDENGELVVKCKVLQAKLLEIEKDLKSERDQEGLFVSTVASASPDLVLQVARLTERNSKLSEDVRYSQSTISAIHRKVQELEEENAKLVGFQKSSTELQHAVEFWQSERNKWHGKYQELSITAQKLNEENKLFSTEIATMKDDVQKWKQAVLEKESEFEREREKLRADRAKEREALLSDVHLQSLNDKQSAYDKRSIALEEKITHLESLRQAHEHALEMHKAKESALQQSLLSLERERASLLADLSTLQRRLNDCEQESLSVPELRKEAFNSREKITALEEELQNVRRLQTVNALLPHMLPEPLPSDSELVVSRDEFLQLVRDFESVSHEKDYLSERNKHLQEKVSHLEEECSKFRLLLSEERSKRKHMRESALEEELQKWKECVAAEISTLRKSWHEAQGLLENSENKVSQMIEVIRYLLNCEVVDRKNAEQEIRRLELLANSLCQPTDAVAPSFLAELDRSFSDSTHEFHVRNISKLQNRDTAVPANGTANVLTSPSFHAEAHAASLPEQDSPPNQQIDWHSLSRRLDEIGTRLQSPPKHS
eukprot:ANDGO_08366.mRNA.1 hypothetical protein